MNLKKECAIQGSKRCAYWGNLLTGMALGIIKFGLCRVVSGIVPLFEVFVL